MRNKIYKKFQKDDKNWSETIFYTIYNKENIKRIKIRGFTYTFWSTNSYKERDFHRFPDRKIDEDLNVLLEWGDINYGLSQYKQKNHITDNIQIELIENAEANEYLGDIQQTFNFANEMVLGEKGEGSKELDLWDINKDTPCGDYFGNGII